MIKIHNTFFKGFIQEKSVSAVWAEKENNTALAGWGGWKVMIRSDGQDYVYCHRTCEHTALETVDEIEKRINEARY